MFFNDQDQLEPRKYFFLPQIPVYIAKCGHKTETVWNICNLLELNISTIFLLSLLHKSFNTFNYLFVMTSILRSVNNITPLCFTLSV